MALWQKVDNISSTSSKLYNRYHHGVLGCFIRISKVELFRNFASPQGRTCRDCNFAEGDT
jgi:hypothetical protein